MNFELYVPLFIFNKNVQNFRAPSSAHHDTCDSAVLMTPQLTPIATTEHMRQGQKRRQSRERYSNRFKRKTKLLKKETIMSIT